MMVHPEIYDPAIHYIYEGCHFSFTNADGEKLWCEWGSANRPDYHAMTITRFRRDGTVEVIST